MSDYGLIVMAARRPYTILARPPEYTLVPRLSRGPSSQLAHEIA